MKKLFMLIVVTFLSLQSSHAKDERASRVSIGAGFAFKKNNRVNNLYKRHDKKVIVTPIPFINASVGRFSIGGEGLAYRALGNHLVNASAFIKFGGDKYLGLGMTPRRTSTWVGISSKIFFKYGLSVQRDISGNSHGYTANLSYGEFFNLAENLMLRAGLSLEWADDRYAEYYYGVRSHEATPNRSEYHLNNYFQPGVNVMPILKFSENLSLTTILGMKLIPKSVRNSPTMNGKKLDLGAIVGIGYTL